MLVLMVLFSVLLFSEIPLSKAYEDTCLPEFLTDGITIEPNKTSVVSGEVFWLKTKYSKPRDCVGYSFSWTTDNPDVIFGNASLKETKATIRPGALSGGKNIIIKAVLSHGARRIEQEAEIRIISANSPPSASLNHDPAFSFTSFNVGCKNSKTGNGFNEEGDRVQYCKATLYVIRNGQQVPISEDSTTANEKGELSQMRLKPAELGDYFIKLEVKDLFGATSIIEEPLEVNKGNTGNDIPVVFINSTLTCFRGEECVFDASETRRRDDNVSVFNYWLMNNGKETSMLKDLKGINCMTSVCPHVFNNTGTLQVKVTANYFRQTKIGYKIVTVTIKNKLSTAVQATPVATVQAFYNQNQPAAPISAMPSTATSDDGCEGYRCKSSPGAGGFALIAILVILARKIKK